MKLARIVVAVDNSDASREAARSAARIATQSGGALTVLTVAPGVGAPGSGTATPPDLLEASLGRDFFAGFPTLSVEVAGVYGLPQVEIGRYAEHCKADLVVLGRKSRSRATRIFLGDTADAVLRRSRIPCLLVPPGQGNSRHVMAALDGTDRGLMVYEHAASFAKTCSMSFGAVTVEPRWQGEPQALAQQVWSTRSERLATRIADKRDLLHVRQGEAVDEIVAEIGAVGADVLVLGFHRGGPALVVESGSVSRKLVHAAPCAVLTVPF
ncbi:MAG: universal stress protein [Gemmatimonadota bacterium]